MLTFKNFIGINNVLPTERLKPNELTVATNVDIGLDGEVRRRAGYTVVSEECHKNLWQAEGFMLATCNGDLKVVGGSVLYPSLGVDRVWYCNLPDGRTAFSNGLISGITDGEFITPFGVPTPTSLGAVTELAGELFPGDYMYALTYVRLSDGLEGAPHESQPVSLPDGGIFLSGLPVEDGYKINVYLSSHNDDGMYLAGSTLTSMFSFIGKNDALVQPCRTGGTGPAPVGTLTTFWRGRVLIADGSTLWASKPHQWESFDRRRDFKQFPDNITLVQTVDDGLYVGTETMLYFLSGTEFDKLQQVAVMRGRVVLGSGVSVSGEMIRTDSGQGDGQNTGKGSAMICIANKTIVAGFNGGQVVKLTENRYETDVQEVWATFRTIDGVPQYVAA
jgi:hypothetical protein